ncbi:endonuclease domain-containing protein [Streptomyces sp. H27-D2]|uniref:endonuclease domain-containing protein n=1 Tax=Streptomyces sp. H27-D2 TaxID=3046304 RepID=UPI003FA74CE7
MTEVSRQRDAERDWLGSTTTRRPTFAEAEVLDRQGTPSCHAWEAPSGRVPPHLSAAAALRLWQAGACAMCSAIRGRLLVDHCHRSGLIRGLLCTNCNTAEAFSDAPSFAAYRDRPPAAMLQMAEQYGSPWDGFGAPSA